MADYGDRSQYAVETCRTTYLMLHVLEDMKDASVEQVRKKAEHRLLELSLKLGRRLEEGDLEDVVAFWAM